MSFNYTNIDDHKNWNEIYSWIFDKIISNKKINNITEFYEEINNIVIHDKVLWDKYYHSNLADINYSDVNLQNAYMLRYCPIYLDTFSGIVKSLNYLNCPNVNEAEIIKIALCCGGPASEMVGIIREFAKRKNFGGVIFNKIHFDIYDINDWSYSRSIFKEMGLLTSAAELKNLNLEITYKDITLNFLDLKKVKETFLNKKNYNFIIFQNALNEIIAQKNKENVNSLNVNQFLISSIVQEPIKSLSKNGYLIFFDRSNKNNSYEEVGLFFNLLNRSLDDYKIKLLEQDYDERMMIPQSMIPAIIKERYIKNPSSWNRYSYRIFQNL